MARRTKRQELQFTLWQTLGRVTRLQKLLEVEAGAILTVISSQLVRRTSEHTLHHMQLELRGWEYRLRTSMQYLKEETQELNEAKRKKRNE